MAKAKPIPEGYTTVTSYLALNDAAQAIDFYKKAFGAQEVYRMPGPGGKIMHAELKIGDSMVMLSDEFPEAEGIGSPKSLGGTTTSLHLYVENADAAFDRAVKAGAKALMPVTDMFWGDRYGKVADPFGHQWGIATHTQDLTPEQVQKNAETFFAQMAQRQEK